MAANKTTLPGKKNRIQNNNNNHKCKPIMTIPEFILHKLGVCLKPEKNPD